MLKFKKEDKIYFDYIKSLKKTNIDPIEMIYHFLVFVGDVNLARFISFFEIFKKVKGLSGHIADIGTWKGASFFTFVKFVKIFEKYSQTQVYGFDWFKGMKQGKNDNKKYNNKYLANYKSLKKMINLQNLQDIAVLEKMNLNTQFKKYLEKNKWLRFKLVFIDCGSEKVLQNTIKYVWPKIVRNGILILDHYNNHVSPTESKILEKYIGKNLIQQLSFVRQPTAYIQKKYK